MLAGGTRTGSRRCFGIGVLLAALSAVFLSGLAPRAEAVAGYSTQLEAEIHPGVVWSQLRDGGPLALDVAKVASDAPVHLVPVISDGTLFENPPGRRHATPTSMCRAAGGVVCVNADYWVCPSCGPPGGGVVIDGVPLRTSSTRR